MLRNLGTSLHRNFKIVLLCASLQVFLGFVVSRTYLLFNNTLFNNASWSSSKLDLEVGVVNAVDFFFKRPALARGSLNLGAWHGFQEVLYRDRLDVERVEFDFKLEPSSYLNVIFNKRGEDCSSVRLSAHGQFKSAYLKVSAQGEYLEKVPIDIPVIRERRWHNAKLVFNSDSLRLLINDQEIARLPGGAVPGRRVGFKGGLHRVNIDNVFIHQNRSEVIFESFENDRDELLTYIYGLALVGLLNGLVFCLLRFVLKKRGKYLGFSLTMINMVLIIASALGYGYIYKISSTYERLITTTAAEEKMRREYWKNSSERFIVSKIKKQHGEAPSKGAYRILFLGSSQTWGSGASKEGSTFVKRLERKLNKYGNSKTTFECVNGSVPGKRSSDMLKLYKRQWRALKPRLIIVNLSSNDTDLEEFKSSLTSIVDISKKNGTRPVFVLEANSIERYDPARRLSKKHQVMKQVASSHNMAVVDMHAYLGERHDDGFLWWDFVHLTDFGHELVARKLFDTLIRVIKVER